MSQFLLWQCPGAMWPHFAYSSLPEAAPLPPRCPELTFHSSWSVNSASQPLNHTGPKPLAFVLSSSVSFLWFVKPGPVWGSHMLDWEPHPCPGSICFAHQHPKPMRQGETSINSDHIPQTLPSADAWSEEWAGKWDSSRCCVCIATFESPT